MRKRFVSLVVAAALSCSLTGMVPAAGAAAVDTSTSAGTLAWVNTGGFFLNGKQVPQMTLMNVNGVPYCTVKYFFENVLASAKVYWANNGSNVTGTTACGESLTLLAQPGSQNMYVNGQSVFVPNGIKIKNGYTMAPIVQLAAVFAGSSVSYDGALNAYVVTTGAYLAGTGSQSAAAGSVQPVAAGQPAAVAANSWQSSGYYDPQALDLIARVINAEAGNMSMEGKVSVGNVIMNRVASSEFPNTVYEVLYQRNQFTVVNYPSFQRTPSAESVAAAKLAMDGVNYVPGAMFYNVTGLRTWASRNRPFLMSFGGHDFYR